MKTAATIIQTLIIIYGTQAFAHDSQHDWRADKAAFASAQVDTKNYVQQRLRRLIQPVAIDPAEFRLKLEELTGLREVMINGKPTRISDRGNQLGREQARQWLTQEYRALGFSVSAHTYTTGSNIIADRAGTSGKILIVSAHMDSMFNAGADDDGAGTVAALLIAKSLKDRNFKHTLRIVAFDNEEQGLVGSNAFVKTLKPTDIIGDIQMEMMAFNSKKDGKFHVIDCDRADSTFMTTAIMEEVQGLGLPLTRVKACTDRSDHGSFWRAKMPAIVLSENFFGGDGDVCYHRACDVLDTRLDLKYASLITTAVANAVAKLIQ